jgi:hypothetical protein
MHARARKKKVKMESARETKKELDLIYKYAPLPYL